ncbi:hypothetical protein NB640_10910 [Oxalobacter vibrioformis]|uniref:Uncharacterized protein n=1 Tax=Oxalobacter vibrioformis TaxID=933080 RepID=A0A9E9LVP8_9BURK|nr:hypothetical protein [Oxalobacter vibrioformis]WAW09724.1 hypothetical protein NB640_10910 [Oxalobacter vibrioformis]
MKKEAGVSWWRKNFGGHFFSKRQIILVLTENERRQAAKALYPAEKIRQFQSRPAQRKY